MYHGVRARHRVECVCGVVKDQLCFLFPADMEDGAMFYEFKGRNEDYQFVQDATTEGAFGSCFEIFSAFRLGHGAAKGV